MTSKVKTSKSVQRRKAMMTNEQSESSSQSPASSSVKKSGTMVIQALRNTQLPDGTFVGAGVEVEVATSYAEKVLKEANTPFSLPK